MQAATDKTVKVTPDVFPTTAVAVQLFEGSRGQLTTWPEFGIHPLSCGGCQSSARRKQFQLHFPNLLTVFENVVNGNPTWFQNAIQLFRDLTYEYCS